MINILLLQNLILQQLMFLMQDQREYIWCLKQFLITLYQALIVKLLRIKQKTSLLKIDLSYFIGKSYFEEDGAQNYLVFQPIRRYFKIIANTKYISSWKSKGLSDETIKPQATSDNSLTSLIDYYGSKVRVKFNKGYLKQPNKLTFDYGRKVNIYIVYELGAFSSNDSDPSLKNCLFGAVTLTKNADIKIWVFWLWN